MTGPVSCTRCLNDLREVVKDAGRMLTAFEVRNRLKQYHEAEHHGVHFEAKSRDASDTAQDINEWRRMRERQKQTRARVSGQCADKRRYSSPEAARKAARIVEQPSVHPYCCRLCGHWHIGKQDRVRLSGAR